MAQEHGLTSIREPSWSPEGDRLAYTWLPCEFARRCGPGRIHTIEPNGSDDIEVLDGPDSFSPDWQPLVGPRREDFKSASHFCKAEHEFLAEGEFKRRYGGGANAYGKCVSSTKG